MPKNISDDGRYIAGSYYRIDDRTGFKVRVRQQKKEWTGLLVHEKVWEYRQPQDFQRPVRDYQLVPEARPRQTDGYVGPITTFVVGSFPAGSTSINVQTLIGMQLGDTIEIMLDTEQYFTTTIVGGLINGDTETIQLESPLPYSTGNLVWSGNIVTDLGGGSGSLAPSNGLIAEDGFTFLVAEDGVTFLVQE